MKKISLVLVIILICSTLGCAFTGIAFAETETVYTDVIEDLSKDDTFDVGQYPAKADDYTLTVFQIAESNAGELFLYVYQPAEDTVTASEVRISTSIGDNLSPKDYKLTLLSRNGTLAKYKVDDLKVLSDVVRYYVIVQIARPFNNELDDLESDNYLILDASESINKVVTVAYEVAKRFTACTLEGSVSYIEEHDEVVTVTDKWFGFIRYSNGFKLYKDSCDSWFIAFNTDMKIDYLYDADVSFMSQKFGRGYNPLEGWFNGIDTEKEPSVHTVKLTDKETAETAADGLFAYKYKWKRIETVDEFKKNESLSEEYLKNLESKTWVLRFTETEYSYFMSAYTGSEVYTVISDVTILRLHFKTNGKTYNLGVIDNKVSGADGPVNDDTNAIDGAVKRLEKIFNSIVKFFDWLVANWWVIVVGVVVIAVVAALIVAIVKKGAGVVFTAIGKALWFLLKYLFIGVGYVVASPVLIVMAIVRAVKEKRGG